jgi:N-acetylmuramoyl-L-alanine amidase
MPMAKISYAQYLELITDPDTADEVIAAFSTFIPGEAAFDPTLVPDPERVEMTQDQIEAESAMKIGNGLARWRRNQAFKRALARGDTRHVLVAEGDSWFQFPIVIRETIDHLSEPYLVCCASAAGDTARNMVFGHIGRGATEYMLELDRYSDRVRAFLFSAAGNDIIGEDDEAGDGTPVLRKILINPQNGSTDPADYINQTEVDTRLAFLEGAYNSVIAEIRSRAHFAALPVLVHGYDVPYPWPWGDQDRRNPRWAKRDQWLGSAFQPAGIEGPLRRDILQNLIDQLYEMLNRVADADEHVHVVDCRGALPHLLDWADEIHGTSDGFAAVADRFRAKLDEVLAGS